MEDINRMKVKQKVPEFQPVSIVLETRDELNALWDIVNSCPADDPVIRQLAIAISNAFSCDIHI